MYLTLLYVQGHPSYSELREMHYISGVVLLIVSCLQDIVYIYITGPISMCLRNMTSSRRGAFWLIGYCYISRMMETKVYKAKGDLRDKFKIMQTFNCRISVPRREDAEN